MFSAVYNYEMNCRLVFRTGESRESFLEYAALAAGNLILDSMILGILVRGGNSSLRGKGHDGMYHVPVQLDHAASDHIQKERKAVWDGSLIS